MCKHRCNLIHLYHKVSCMGQEYRAQYESHQEPVYVGQPTYEPDLQVIKLLLEEAKRLQPSLPSASEACIQHLARSD